MNAKRASSASDSEWFARWFGEDYKRLYPHRDEVQASGQVDSLLRVAAAHFASSFLPDGLPRRALDVGCGAGRHLRALRARGVSAFGIDLSPVLLEDARDAFRKGTHGTVGASPVARADMRRLPFGDGTFDLVACFFTTFGYFDSHEEDLDSLRELRRVARPSGLVFLDLPNAAVVRRDLVASEEVSTQGLRAQVTRRLEGDRVIKRIRILSADGDEIHEERVRLYERGALGASLESLGFSVMAEIGDERGAAFDAETSPRMSLLLRRSA